uniref:VWFC domain-containing protein n=1 Tax=Romanomermis culicivorax TaxID=13658 RepID=A0A915L3F4_ROMCU
MLITISKDNIINVKVGRQGCSFGDRFYELGQTWHPDLGEPFGVLACTKCNCSTITKKRRVIGKVVCNNLANSCPKLHCPKVVSIKGQCCNVCADGSSSEKHTNLPEKVEKTQKMIHGEFMALLTARFKSPPVQSDNLARAYITLNDKDLHFAISYEKLDEQPSSVQILDGQDYLLYEKNLSTTTNNKTSKSFGAAGAAAFEVAKGGKNLKMMLWFNSTLDKAEADPQIIVWLERNDGVRRKIDMAKVIKAKHSSAYHTVEMSINIHPTEKSHLIKGHLNLVVTCNEMSPTELTGRIAPKSSCDVFHAVSDIVDAGKLSNNVLGAASIRATLNPNGTVAFDVKMVETPREYENLPQATFRLVRENPRNKKARIILSSGAIVESSSGMRVIRNVSISRMPLRDRDAFYKGKLYAQLEIEKHGIVKARINRLPFREALAGNQALFVSPITINRLAPRSVNENVKPIPTTPLPIALFYNVENLNSFQTPCQFFYLLAVYDSTSANDEKSFKLSLCQEDSARNCAPLNFSSRENLVGPDRSSGSLLIGRSDYLYSDQWMALRDGRAYFNLTLINSQRQQSVVTGKWNNVTAV